MSTRRRIYDVPSYSSGDFEIGQMREADLDGVIEIEKRAFVEPWSRRIFRETISFPLSFNLVIRKKVDNKVAGYANFYVIGGEVQILNVAIAPEERKKSYATILLTNAIALLREQGAEDFFLEVRESNADAIKLYLSLGFRQVGRRKKYYTETNEDALVMHLKVEDGTD
jgi:[ribosomal protein S18]-alanine N-acetyltransferase